MANILDGKATAAAVRDELKERVDRLREAGTVPRLVVLLVGEDPASQVYVRNKGKAARKIGIDGETLELPATISQTELEARVRELGDDPSVHGILVQLPLPKGLDEERVVRCIPPSKDVDGLHPVNVGDLARGTPAFAPCTPAGCVELLVRHGVEIAGRHVVIVGRSNLVGRPLASLLLLKGARGDASTTVCHSRSRNLADIVRQGDIVVAAVGRPNTITADMVRPGAVVVDVGINRIDDPSAKGGSRLVGDVDYDAVADVASWITPVPGGVGPMTIAMLLANTVQAAEAHAGSALVRS
ncbi:MAG: bifunctional methylenetetrahydrofolate dehydrogenase/methenyltetrahydrofolate cyclohydrolase FolD [Gemmatimonadetes bacterium]|nr:bifunctional methylenetetrahydrofolate dehydrogenase/methenyltetrahydrofolate cyclohydrolase FolD [Gemmatimonadota bacterium]